MILLHPVITEKSIVYARLGIFTFAVDVLASKHQIAHDVATTFGVNVIRVNLLRRHVPAKKTGNKRLVGSPRSVKHARVQLKSGQTIDLFDLKEKN